jgi:hypothetical protein
VRPYPSLSETNIGSDITRNDNDSVQEGDHADDRSDGAVTDSNVEPFALKPPQLAALVNPKSLENLERLGGIENLLDGLGTDRVRGLNTSKRLRRPGSPDLNAAVPSTASLGGAPGVDRSTFLNEATIEDRPRVYGHHNLPHRTSKRLLLSTWLALHGKVLVSQKISHTVSLNLISASVFVVDPCPSIPCPWHFPHLQFIPH